MRGRAKDNAHRSVADVVSREFPVVSMDWCYLGRKEDPHNIPVLVVKDSSSKGTFAHGTPGAVIVTGEYGERTIKAVIEDLDNLGYKRILLKNGQEPSIKALQQRVKEAWTGEVIKQNSPVASFQSNGPVEKAILDVEDQVRTLKLAL